MLYPIIRRVRRPLLPVEPIPAKSAPAAEVKSPEKPKISDEPSNGSEHAKTTEETEKQAE
jgi:hypothetical protein